MTAPGYTENPAKDVPERTIKVRRLSYEPSSVVEVTLRKRHAHTKGYDAGDEVYLDGTWIGTVERYKGSIDTQIAGTRLRRQGVTRTLWALRGPGMSRSFFEYVSRAEAIRYLIGSAERRSKKED